MSQTKNPGDTQFAQLTSALAAWNIPSDAIDTVHDLARVSLNEVKALTEYEDGKVTRVLTVAAFLSAVVGIACGNALKVPHLRRELQDRSANRPDPLSRQELPYFIDIEGAPGADGVADGLTGAIVAHHWPALNHSAVESRVTV